MAAPDEQPEHEVVGAAQDDAGDQQAAAARQQPGLLAGLAAELGVRGISLYTHVNGKDALLEDRPLMLAAELGGQLLGAGFAFRTDSTPACKTATLRNVAVRPPYRGLGLERRLIQRIEQAAAGLGVTGIILGGPRGAERQFFVSMGYRGRHEGGLMGKQLPLTPRQRDPAWRERLEDLRGRRQSRLAARQQGPA